MMRHNRELQALGLGIGLLMLCHWLGTRGFATTRLWHTLVFHAGIVCILYSIIGWVAPLMGADKSNQRTLLISTSLCLILLELAVRLAGFERTYIEQRSGWYQSFYQQGMKDPLRVHRHYKEFWMETPEYRYHRTVNSHGFADFEFVPKEPGELLIQTYGDSFTEGDGAPADSSYPALLRNIVAERGMSHVKVQNFGMSGNDPGFYWRQLRDVGIQMNPDIVAITYCSLDLTTDFFTRGGLERFRGEGWSSIKGPWWEFIYANSHLSRWLMRVCTEIDVSSFLTTPLQREDRLRELEIKWNEAFDSIAALAVRHGFDVLLLKKPERSEISLAEYQYDFTFFDRAHGDNPAFHHFDLLDYYLHACKLTADSTARYFWAKDGHHNPVGYHLMARGAYHALHHSFPERFGASAGDTPGRPHNGSLRLP